MARFLLNALAVVSLVVAIAVVLVDKFVDEQGDVQVEQLPKSVQLWKESGAFYPVLGHEVFAIWLNRNTSQSIILIHGFPTSSYDYHRAFNKLQSSTDLSILMFDHVGFGFSDKPREGFTYSLMDHADVALELWRNLGIREAHLVAHDMGDSVVTEILTRFQRRMLPDYFDSFFKSVVFTNGGMHYQSINFRWTQSVLMTSYLGPLVSSGFAKMPPSLFKFITRQQLLSIWAPNSLILDTHGPDEDIDAIVQMIRHNGGHKILHHLIQYLNDRRRFEDRWFSSLKQLHQLRVLLLWGDSDAVAPLDIAKHLARVIFGSNAAGITMQNTGHFLMLERPDDWVKLVTRFIHQS